MLHTEQRNLPFPCFYRDMPDTCWQTHVIASVHVIFYIFIYLFSILTGQASIRRRSKIPGVTITQYLPKLPQGKSTPDFQSKPAPINTKEGNSSLKF